MPKDTAPEDTPTAATRKQDEEEAVAPEGQVVAEIVDPYRQVLNPYELPANPVAAAAYPGGNVDPAAPISDERIAQATAAIEAEQEVMQGAVPPEHPALAEAPAQGA